MHEFILEHSRHRTSCKTVFKERSSLYSLYRQRSRALEKLPIVTT